MEVVGLVGIKTTCPAYHTTCSLVTFHLSLKTRKEKQHQHNIPVGRRGVEGLRGFPPAQLSLALCFQRRLFQAVNPPPRGRSVGIGPPSWLAAPKFHSPLLYCSIVVKMTLFGTLGWFSSSTNEWEQANKHNHFPPSWQMTVGSHLLPGSAITMISVHFCQHINGYHVFKHQGTALRQQLSQLCCDVIIWAPVYGQPNQQQHTSGEWNFANLLTHTHTCTHIRSITISPKIRYADLRLVDGVYHFGNTGPTQCTYIHTHTLHFAYCKFFGIIGNRLVVAVAKKMLTFENVER